MKPIDQNFPEIEHAQFKINDSVQSIESQITKLQTLKTYLLSLKLPFQVRAKELELNKRGLDSFQKFLLDRDKELKLREEKLNSIQKSIDDRQKELELRENQLNSAEKKFVCKKCKTLGFKVRKSNDESGFVKFSMRMNGRILQMFLNDRFNEHELIGDEVYYALKLSNDPAKLVLDAMQGFFPPHLRKDDIEYDESVVRSTCVLLLEQLMNMKPEINKAVREEAKGLAGDWRDRITNKGVSYMVVLGFLLLVVAYDLADDFDKAELRRFCDVIHRTHRLSGQVRSRLGFFSFEHSVLQKCQGNNTSSQAKKEPTGTADDGENNNVNMNDNHNNKSNINNIYCHQDSHYQKDSHPGLIQIAEDLMAKMQSASFHLGLGNNRCTDTGKEKRTTMHTTVAKAVKVQAKKETPNNYANNSHPYRNNHPVWTPPFPEVRKAQIHSTSPQYSPVTKWNFSEKENASIHISKAVSSPFDIHSFCKKMDAVGLKTYLVDHVKDLNLANEKVFLSLRHALDPAKLVLKVVREFYQESNEIQGDTFQSCCNVLLEALLKLSPDISVAVDQESKIFASLWKTRLAKEGNKPLYVWVFLKFVAAYKLVSSLGANELLSLFSTFYNGDDIYEPEKNPNLCHALGLEAKIPDHIQCLIQENQRLEAVRYICAFSLTNEFPPVPLLKEHLEYTTVTALERCKDSDNSIKAQNKCAKEQILALQGVIRCIFCFKLESEYSPIQLTQRIRHLQKEKEERKSLQRVDEKGGEENQAVSSPTRKRPRTEAEDLVSHSSPIEMAPNMSQSPDSEGFATINSSIPGLPTCDFLLAP